MRVDRPLDREPRELVAERDRVVFVAEDPRGQALVELRERAAGKDLQQRQLDPLRDDSDGVEQRTSIRPETGSAGEHRVADRGRNIRHPRRQRLRDEERVARRLAVQLFWVDAVRRCELADGVEGERGELDAAHPRGRRELADNDSERMRPVELIVPIGGDHQCLDRLDPATEQPQDVERRFVGPVDVLEDNDRRLLRVQLVPKRGEHGLRLVPPVDEFLQRFTGLGGDVEERAQWSRSV